MSNLTLFSLLVSIVGMAFTVVGIRRLLQRRYLHAAGLEFSGLIFLLLAASAFLLASNLYTYERLVFEQAVAEVSFVQVSEQSYRTTIQSLDSSFKRQLDLQGDEWQLDAQVLTWHGLATLFGLDANYRLHRIAGRYVDIEEEQNKPRSVFSLVQTTRVTENEEFDLWQLANKYREWLRWVDAAYGSAVFLPMTDGAVYRVSVSRTGLIARPANAVARKAVSQWIGL